MSRTPELHPDRPLPDVDDPIAGPFWEFCRRHELRLQRDRSSGQFIFPPRPHYAGDFEWVRLSGRGRIFSFVVVHPPFLPAFEHKLPFMIALVEVEEGPRLVGNLLECPIEVVKTGMEVEVVFEDLTQRVTLPQWRPARGRG